jgi:hypothetical protein
MFRQGFTCPALLDHHPEPHHAYGAITRSGRPFQTVRLIGSGKWPNPLSLATTRGISVDVFSSRY